VLHLSGQTVPREFSIEYCKEFPLARYAIRTDKSDVPLVWKIGNPREAARLTLDQLLTLDQFQSHRLA
jgi:hypothetical protein